MTIKIAQLHTIGRDDVSAMIARHYGRNSVPVNPHDISYQILGDFGGGDGFSGRSGPYLGAITIRFPTGGKRPVGMPTSMDLRPEQLQEIAAEFLTEELGFAVAPANIDINVVGHGGSGFSQTSSRLESLTMRSTRTVD